MSLNLLQFIKKLLPSLSKSEMESDMDGVQEGLTTVRSVFTTLSEAFSLGKFNAKTNQTLVKDFYKEYHQPKPKTKAVTGRNFVSDFLGLLQNLQANAEFIRKEVQDISNEVVVTQALTAYKANVIRAVTHFQFLVRYGLDLANFLYINEAQEGEKFKFDKSAELNKKQKAFIQDNLWVFARLLAVYGEDASVFKDKIESIEKIVLPKDDLEEASSSTSISKLELFDNLPSNFIGSPAYSIGMYFAQREADNYRRLKDEKKLIELRHLHLRLLKDQGSSDASLEKDIEMLQNRITEIDYAMAKIEESIE